MTRGRHGTARTIDRGGGRLGHGSDTRVTPALADDRGIRLVALDLDGTILEAGRRIAPDVVAALRTLRARGVRCVTATGRPLGFQLALFADYGLGPIAGTPAALMVDERELFFLPAGTSAADNGADGQYQPYDTWNSTIRGRWRTLHAEAMAWLGRAQAEARARGWEARHHLSPEDALARGLPTLEFDQPDQAAALCDWLAAALAAEAPALACNRNVRLVQVHDRLVGKGPVLAELARYWGIPPCRVLAIGDSLNDASMLDGRLGFRVATVGNADERVAAMVRAAGGYVASERVGEGVLEVLRAWNVGGLAGVRDQGAQ